MKTTAAAQPQRAGSRLTNQEREEVLSALQGVLDCMEWDSDLGAYIDGGNFIMSCGKEQIEALRSAYSKLSGVQHVAYKVKTQK